MSEKKTNKTEKVLEHLEKYGHITSLEAIEKYGAIKGSLLGLKRILKCNPISKGGYDPLK